MSSEDYQMLKDYTHNKQIKTRSSKSNKIKKDEDFDTKLSKFPTFEDSDSDFDSDSNEF